MTKMTYVNAINLVLEQEVFANREDMSPTLSEALVRLEELRDSIDKRNSKPSKAERERAEQNSALYDKILEGLGHMTIPVTISEFMSAAGGFSEYKVQKLSPIFKKLVEEGKVVRTEEKHKAYFRLAD